MKSELRIIAMMALTFVPAVHAQTATNAKAQTPQDESVAGAAAPPVIATAPPNADRGPSSQSLTALSSQQGSPPLMVKAIHRWSQVENTPEFEWFAGYSFWWAVPPGNNNRISYLSGESTSAAFNLNRYAGLVTDFAAFGNGRLTFLGPAGNRTVNSNSWVFSYTFGPRFSYRRFERITPYVQALFGVAYASSVTIDECAGGSSCTPLKSDLAFAGLMGAGLDVKINHRIALRLLEADFLLTNFRDPFSASGQTRDWQSNLRLSSGIVFRFGERE